MINQKLVQQDLSRKGRMSFALDPKFLARSFEEARKHSIEASKEISFVNSLPRNHWLRKKAEPLANSLATISSKLYFIEEELRKLKEFDEH